MITADTKSLETIVSRLNDDVTLSTLVVECSFPSSMEHVATKSKHLTAKWLFEALAYVKNKKTKIYINHIKPEYKEEIELEIDKYKGDWHIEILEDGDEIGF